jgi:hypothetical protein
VGGPFKHRPEHGERARRGSRATIDNRPAVLLGLNVRLALAGGNVSLEFHHIVMGQRRDELPTQQRLYVALDIRAIGGPARRLLVRLRGRALDKVEIRQGRDCQRLAPGAVAFGRGITALCHFREFVDGNRARLIRCQGAHSADHQPA